MQFGKRQILILILAAGFVIFGGIYFLGTTRGIARLEIEIGENKRAFEGEVLPGMTILEALQASIIAGNIKFNYTLDQDRKLKIDSLDGFNADSEKKMVIRLNTEPIPPENINSIPVKSGDVISISAE